MKNIIWLMLLTSSVAFTQQYKSYKLLDNGDTLNRIDNDNKKQGKWKVHVNALRLDPAYDEEGSFVDDKKEGVWRKYDMYGLLFAKENYKWGYKSGLQQYLLQGQLEREENWLVLDPKKQYDTIEVQDVYDQFRYEKRIVKIENPSLEHGAFKYYDPETGRLLRTTNYVLGELATEPKKDIAIVTDSVKPKVKPPKAVEDFEKSTKGKKKVVRDARGMGY